MARNAGVDAVVLARIQELRKAPRRKQVPKNYRAKRKAKRKRQRKGRRGKKR